MSEIYDENEENQLKGAIAIKTSEHRKSGVSNDNIEQLQDSNSTNDLMPAEIRRATVYLLRHGVILSSQKQNLFATLSQHQSTIRKFLSNIYLKLVLDEKKGVAFIARMEKNEDESDSDEEPVSLITRRMLSLFDTLILIVLRKYYQEREATGEQRVFIDIDRIESNLTPFTPLTNSTTLERKKLKATIKRFVEKRLLNTVQNNEDRYEITPVIRYVVNAEFLETLLEEYKKIAAESSNDSLGVAADLGEETNHG